MNAIRNMAIQAILKDNLGRVFYSLNEGLIYDKQQETFMPLINPQIKNFKITDAKPSANELA